MTPIVKTEPWPGTDGGNFNSVGNGTGPGEGWLHIHSRTAFFTNGRGYDVGSCCDLLRLYSRGMCRNPGCHTGGKGELQRSIPIGPSYSVSRGGAFMPLPFRGGLERGRGLKVESISVAVQNVILHKALPKYWRVVSGVTTLWQRY